ncbi:transposase [Pseudomonas sp. FSL W5-0299]|nr:transposase [Pseudomonas sp. FSL W5-0299]
MYSYEDRIRAVKLYIKLVKHTGATIRQLGYSTKNSLKSWHEEYERCLDLSRGYVLSKPKYSLAQREKAVGYYLDHGRCIASTIKALGYPAQDSLCAWIHELPPELHTRVVGRSDGLARLPAMK